MGQWQTVSRRTTHKRKTMIMELLEILGVKETNPWAHILARANGPPHRHRDDRQRQSGQWKTDCTRARRVSGRLRKSHLVARGVFADWRQVPAPRRGEAVRLCTEALRRHKDSLGSLVSLEKGKIKAEGTAKFRK